MGSSASGRRYLITGGAGFIGSAFVEFLFGHEQRPHIRVLDKLSYSGTVEGLRACLDEPRFEFINGDICDRETVRAAIDGVDVVVNFAAEVAVDRSIVRADGFLRTGVLGLHVLLEEARAYGRLEKFLQISTDEVYGPVETGSCREDAPLAPRNPYAAAKVGGEMLARTYFETHGVPVNITRATNTYGPRAHPEKVIPLFITNLLDGKPLPIFGDGRQVRDWLYVEDHCSGIHTVLQSGAPGETYNIAGGQECTNLDLTMRLLDVAGFGPEMITFVNDRPGHDRRYSVNAERLSRLGWSPRTSLDEGLARTFDWYRTHEAWWRPLKQALDRRYEHGFWGGQTCAV